MACALQYGDFRRLWTPAAVLSVHCRNFLGNTGIDIGQHLLSGVIDVLFRQRNEPAKLVLGAFGCGAFCNDPEVVASAYKTAIGVFPKVFQKIVFAVYCSPMDTRNYETFSRILQFGE